MKSEQQKTNEANATKIELENQAANEASGRPDVAKVLGEAIDDAKNSDAVQDALKKDAEYRFRDVNGKKAKNMAGALIKAHTIENASFDDVINSLVDTYCKTASLFKQSFIRYQAAIADGKQPDKLDFELFGNVTSKKWVKATLDTLKARIGILIKYNAIADKAVKKAEKDVDLSFLLDD